MFINNQFNTPYRSFGLVASLMLGMAAAVAAEPPAVHEAWARATPPGVTTGAVYLTLVGGTEADRIIGVRTDAAATAQLHTETSEGGLLTMKKLDALAIPAKTRVELAPGHEHVMLMGLRGPLKPGDTIRLTLTFERAGDVAIEVPVRDARGASAVMHHEHAMPNDAHPLHSASHDSETSGH